MAISVSHQPSFKALGNSAYAAGAGFKQQREKQLKEERSARNAQLAMQAYGDNQRNQQYERRNDIDQEAVELRRQMHQDEMGLQLAEGMEAKEQLERNFEVSYSDEQLAEYDAINDSISKVRQQFAGGELNIEQAEQMERQLNKKLKAIIPTKHYKGPSQQEMFQQSLVYDPMSGNVVGYRDDKGKINQLPNAPTFKDISDMYKTVQESLTTYDSTTEQDTKPDPAQVRQGVLEMIKTQQDVLNFMAGGSPNQQQAQQMQQPEPPHYQPEPAMAKSRGVDPVKMIETKVEAVKKNPYVAIQDYKDVLDEKDLLILRKVFQSRDEEKIRIAIQRMVEHGIIQ